MLNFRIPYRREDDTQHFNIQGIIYIINKYSLYKLWRIFMKKLVNVSALLVFVFISSSFAQSKNPDGDYISIHFNPYLTAGSYETLNKSTRIAKWDSNGGAGYEVKVVIPLGSKFTMAPYYNSEMFSYSYKEDNHSINYEALYDYEMKFKQNRLGVNLSYYFK